MAQLLAVGVPWVHVGSSGSLACRLSPYSGFPRLTTEAITISYQPSKPGRHCVSEDFAMLHVDYEKGTERSSGQGRG